MQVGPQAEDFIKIFNPKVDK